MRDTINNIAEEINTKPIAVALAWVLEQKNILTAIVGSRKADQVPEFATAGSFKLNANHLEQLNNIADALLEYESISGSEMTQIINGEAIARSESIPKKKRVRRRKKTSKKAAEEIKGANAIITKPATS